MTDQKPDANTEKHKDTQKKPDLNVENAPKVKEIGGPEGPEPTRYGDWEVGGRCTDF